MACCATVMHLRRFGRTREGEAPAEPGCFFRPVPRLACKPCVIGRHGLQASRGTGPNTPSDPRIGVYVARPQLLRFGGTMARPRRPAAEPIPYRGHPMRPFRLLALLLPFTLTAARAAE